MCQQPDYHPEALYLLLPALLAPDQDDVLVVSVKLPESPGRVCNWVHTVSVAKEDGRQVTAREV